MPSNQSDDRQWAEWKALFGKVKEVLTSWGTEDAFGRADFLIVDDNYGMNRHIVEIHKLRMLKLPVIQQLRSSLRDFPDWEIVMALDIPGKEHWPRMGVTIRKHEIIDGLRRDVLPPEFKDFTIPGSRPGTGYD